MIAAVADVYGEPIVTDNVKDFEVLGVEIESY
jgi:predicted nucleic acid-binding protein